MLKYKCTLANTRKSANTNTNTNANTNLNTNISLKWSSELCPPQGLVNYYSHSVNQLPWVLFECMNHSCSNVTIRCLIFFSNLTGFPWRLPEHTYPLFLTYTIAPRKSYSWLLRFCVLWLMNKRAKILQADLLGKSSIKITPSQMDV